MLGLGTGTATMLFSNFFPACKVVTAGMAAAGALSVVSGIKNYELKCSIDNEGKPILEKALQLYASSRNQGVRNVDDDLPDFTGR